MKVGRHMAKDIFGLFAKRRAHWRAQNLKYLRYVFNDHFVLVLMFLIGFLAYQYADFLKKLPEHWWPGYVIAVLISLLILLFGRLATFVEKPDQLFLLAKEKAVQTHLINAVKGSLILPAVLIVLMTMLISPLIHISLVVTLVWALVLIAIKYGLLLKKGRMLFLRYSASLQMSEAYNSRRNVVNIWMFYCLNQKWFMTIFLSEPFCAVVIISCSCYDCLDLRYYR